MTTYTVTAANYNSSAFWSSISESASGHVLDFTGLPSSFFVSVQPTNNIIWIWDGSAWSSIGEAGASTNFTLGAPTDLDFFTEVRVGDSRAELLGSSANETLVSGAGNDTIDGGSGADIVWAGDGADNILGGTDNDTLSGNAGTDTIDGGDGADNLQGGQSGDSIAGGAGNDNILGDGQWYDPVAYASGPGTIATNLTVTNVADGPIELWWIDGSGTLVEYATIQPGQTHVQPTFEDHNWILRDEDGFYLELIEGAPNQTVTYGAEGLADSIDGGEGNDTIYSQFGDDTIDGGAGNDSIDGGDGNDVLDGGEGIDNIIGGSGNDTIDGGNRSDSISGGDGDDLILDSGGSLSDDTIFGGSGNDTISGGLREDYLDGGADADTFLIEDGFGNDTIIGGEGITTGTDYDTIDLSAVTSGVTVDWTGSEAGTVVNGADTLTFSEIEHIILTDSADNVDASTETVNISLDGAGGNDTLRGGSGNDTLLGGDGVDRLYGGAGDDRLEGGAGSDRFFSDAGDDLILGGSGRDVYNVTDGFGNDTVDLGSEDIVIDNGFTAGTISFYNLTSAITITYSGSGGTATDGTNTITFDNVDNWDAGLFAGGIFDARLATYDVSYYDYGGATTAYGSAFNDVIGAYDADASNRYYDGGAGDDTLDTGGGNDTILGGDGNDDIVARGGDDLIEGGAGNDTIYAGDGADTIAGGDGDDFIDGGAGDDFLTTGLGNDTLIGGAGNDTLMNSDGDDSLVGGAGNDSIVATGGDDTLEGGDGNDTLDGGADNDSLDGGAGDDSLDGGSGSDFIEGGSGSDTISGGGPGAPAYTDVANDNQNAVGTTDQDFFRWLAEPGSNARIFLDDNTGGDRTGDGVADFVLVETTNDTGTLGLRGFDYGLDKVVLQEPYTGLSFTAIDRGGDQHSATATITYANGNSQTFTFEMNGVGPIMADQIFTTTQPTIAGNDTLSGGDDADTFIIEDNFGNDTIIGGEGGNDNDLIDLSGLTGPVTVSYSGNEAGTITDGNGNTITFSEIERLILTDQADSLDGSLDGAGLDVDAGAGDDTLYGGSANDTLLGGDGADSIWGQEGNDSLSGGDGNDTIEGQVGNDSIDGGAGDDSLRGGDGNDTVLGGTGSDTISGGIGDDVLNGGDGDDALDGGAGSDTLLGGLGRDTLAGGEGADFLHGDQDIDLADYSASDAAVTIVLDGTGAAGTASGGHAQGDTIIGIDDLVGSDFDDSLTGYDATFGGGLSNMIDGGAGNDTIAGLGGDDSLIGGAGDDSILGGAGADTISGGDGADSLNAGADNDSVDGGTGNDTIDAGTGDDTVDGGDGNDRVFGWTGDDSIRGGDGDDTLFGQDGNDTIYGGAGNDSLDGDDGAAGADLIFGEDGNDTIIGDAGNDTLSGGAGADSIFAGSDDDSVTGNRGNDWISGEAGNDTLAGGTGDDTLFGGDGTDTFTYTAGDGNDTIGDFNTGNTGTLSDGDSTNNDFINLSAFYDDIWELHADQADDGVLNQSNDGVDGADYSNNASFGSGSLTFTGASADNTSFTSENTGVVCFASGTAIRTPEGEVMVETLRAGDLVTTQDHGPSTVLWIGCTEVALPTGQVDPRRTPVRIKPDVVSGGRALLVSPQHCMMMTDATGQPVLVRARHLAEETGLAAFARGRSTVTYWHVLLEQHSVLISQGRPSESYYPGPNGVAMMAAPERARLLKTLPALRTAPVETAYGPRALKVLTRSEVRSSAQTGAFAFASSHAPIMPLPTKDRNQFVVV